MPTDDARVPRATYRLQLCGRFTFADAAAIVDYLADLGVSHVYSSPYLQATAGSEHGYDGVDPSLISDDLGGREGFDAWVTSLRAHRLGLVADVVPNHLGIADRRNRWWQDVLRHGQQSEFASAFDIDWDTDDPELRGKVLVPVLGQPLDDELRAGAIRIERGGDEWIVRYADLQLPLAPGTAGPDAPTDAAGIRHVLDRQHYVLAWWREALTRLDYRRFFDVTTLAGVRVERPDVFDAMHALVLQQVASGVVDGLRIDHIDGLADPAGYLERLAARAPGAWRIVEKVLCGAEELDAAWPIDGTTGYDALAEITDVIVDPLGSAPMTAAYERVTEERADFEATMVGARLQVARELLVPEVRRCAHRLQAIAAQVGLEVDEPHARAVIEAFAAELPVYRTYAWPGRPTSAHDLDLVVDVVDRVLTRHPEVMPRAIAVLADAFVHPCDATADLVRGIQQLTGPVMAKGTEDTAFYRDARLVALNEVGGHPDRFGADVATFHDRAARRMERWAYSMVTTSTHDTKRSEDVRARLAVLSEIPDVWAATIDRWCARTARWWTGPGSPDRALDVLVHQTIVGAHPLDAERAHAYLTKAMREAKRRTSWIDPDRAFEDAAHAVLDRALHDPEHMGEVEAFVARLLPPGRRNALAQKLLALTMPGVPDLYQGSELWTLDLVDPDNRRAVDYDLRRRLLAQVPDAPTTADAARWAAALHDPGDPGLAKLAVVHHALRVRRSQRHCFVGPAASYRPVEADGPAAEHVLAFARGTDVVVVLARHTLRLEREGGWRQTRVRLPAGEWRDVLSQSMHATVADVQHVLAHLPVALLVRT